MSAGKRRQLRRWGVFNAVGILGFVLQLAVLLALKRGLSMNYLTATALAVEAAVLHNFVWHEHLTWADVVAPFRHGVWTRLLRFHIANGLISILGNLGFTWVLVEGLRWPYLAANVASVLICSLVNFFASDRFVFQPLGEVSAGHRFSVGGGVDNARKDAICAHTGASEIGCQGVNHGDGSGLGRGICSRSGCMIEC